MAHTIHLLLTVDSLYRISEIVDVVKKCKNLVTTLHFKSYILEEESLSEQDRSCMDDLMEKIDRAKNSINLDERFPNEDLDDGEEDSEEDNHVASSLDLNTTSKQDIEAKSANKIIIIMINLSAMIVWQGLLSSPEALAYFAKPL